MTEDKPMQKAVLGRDQFLAESKPEIVAVETSRGIAHIKKISAKTKGQFQANFVGADDATRKRLFAESNYRFLAMCLVDETGALICQGEKDIQALGEQSSDFIDELAEYAEKVNPLSKKDAVEDRIKNLEATQGNDSSTD